MRKLTLSGMVLALAAFFGIMQYGSPTAFARSSAVAQMGQTQTGQHVQLPGKSQYHMARKQSKRVHLYVGTITKKNGHYVLTDGGFSYKLSNQAQAMKDYGKEVEVSGRLNPKTNKIKVKKIKVMGGSNS